MKKLILLVILLISGFVFSQEISKDTYIEVEKIAEFPDGGIQNFRKLVAKNFRARKVKGRGKENCEVKFVIERDGSIVDIDADGSNESFNKEAVIALSKITTKWKPATINGIPVRYKYRMPLTFNFN